MLNSKDLQAIGALVKTIVARELEEKLDRKFDEKLAPIKEDINSMKNDIRYMKALSDQSSTFMEPS